MGKLQRIFITFIIILAIGSAIIISSFGSVLFQEGNPVPLMVSAMKLHLFDSEYVEFSKTEKRSRYLSKNIGDSRYDIVKEFMKSKGWIYEEQMGSGLIFVQDDREAIVETRQYSKYFIIWDVQQALFTSDSGT
ncbi:hypothetical protein QNH39_13980 [Neobacillus novalis]|uniref:Uncharacterized protein n=1 Tax=Neobacillus novalis TaxID=220687 RepID=A0AA95SDD0_9BACI|nr:hypothetical protein [Neobacillus novalis]WHY88872.1 hypothetical protein QNH39_13980 [Neobacillus novalis]